jgi:dihydroxyacetone kinase
MVIVGDDCALPPPPRGPLGRRGLAGTLFVHKVLMPFFKATICLLASCTEFCASFLTDNNIKLCHLDEC